MQAIVLPGIGGSGETHWQTVWERRYPGMQRFEPSDWERPELSDWVAALDHAVGTAVEPPLLVAHSLACLLVAHWQAVSKLSVSGAFLVAVPDPAASIFPTQAASFVDPPQSAFRFPSLIVASSDDPYGTIDYARKRAAQWRSGLLEIGARGHISSLGEWPEGLDLLHQFRAETKP